MKFNSNLLENFTDEKIDLAKFVLFSIEQDLRMDLILKESLSMEVDEAGSITWKETILQPVQEVILELVRAGIIEETYERLNCRYKLLRPLYVTKRFEIGLVTSDLVTQCRKYFAKSYCGVSDRNARVHRVRQHLIMFLEKNPDVDISRLPQCFKYIVDTRKKAGKDFVPKILDFINAEDDQLKENKDLLMYLEELEDGEGPIEDTGSFI